MKQHSIALKTMAIKARVYNQIRTDLYKKHNDSLSKEQKIEFFDKWFTLNHNAHWELVDYKRKRERKSEINRLRQERGWKPKQKVPKKVG